MGSKDARNGFEKGLNGARNGRSLRYFDSVPVRFPIQLFFEHALALVISARQPLYQMNFLNVSFSVFSF